MDLYLLHHYIQRGHDLEKLLNLSKVQKLFFIASMQKEEADRKNRISL